MIVRKSLFVLFLTVITFVGFSQTKEETVAYVNNILTLHNNGSMFHSLRLLPNMDVSADLKIFLQGTNSSTLSFVFSPKDALYINTNIKSNGVGTIVISFKGKSVRIMGDDGKPFQFDDNITMEGLVSMSSTEMEKVKKAIIHLVALLGGEIKKDPF